MKNLLKIMGVAAIAGMFSLNVNAATTCSSDEHVHTDYFMFLDYGGKTAYENKLASVSSGVWSYTTGADKYNQIKGKTIIEQGNVAITDGISSTYNTDEEWDITKYWKRMYYALKGVKTSTQVYTDDDESYLLHTDWWKYDNIDSGAATQQPDDKTIDKLLIKYIKDNYNGLKNSDLVKKGTILPATTIDAPASLATSSDTSLRWRLTRVYNEDVFDGMAGVQIDSTDSQSIVYFAPAVYYVKYCVAGAAETTEKAITYDKNTTDTVDKMPTSPQKFTTSCTNVNSVSPTRSGYTFVGWNADKDATTATLQPGAEYCGESTTLYAIWKPVGKFTVTYDANGGTDAPKSESGDTATGTCVTISKDKPKLSGNTFLGWTTNKTKPEKEDKYDAGKTYCGENGDLTLYAVWRVNSGVSAHLIAFGIVAVSAAAALIVAKKKDLFKQI